MKERDLIKKFGIHKFDFFNKFNLKNNIFLS